jgi:hypothetical protein
VDSTRTASGRERRMDCDFGSVPKECLLQQEHKPTAAGCCQEARTFGCCEQLHVTELKMRRFSRKMRKGNGEDRYVIHTFRALFGLLSAVSIKNSSSAKKLHIKNRKPFAGQI